MQPPTPTSRPKDKTDGNRGQGRIAVAAVRQGERLTGLTGFVRIAVGSGIGAVERTGDRDDEPRFHGRIYSLHRNDSGDQEKKQQMNADRKGICERPVLTDLLFPALIGVDQRLPLYGSGLGSSTHPVESC